MTTPVLSVVIDTVEPRIGQRTNKQGGNRIADLIDGRHVDTLLSTTYLDGITYTSMLMPLYKTDAWKTTTSGLYARLGKADYTFETPPFVAVGTPPPYPDGTPTDPAKWIEDAVDIAGNTYLTAQGVNDRAKTNRKWPKNRPMLISWFAFNSGQSRSVQIECGWYSDVGLIALRVWTDGKCEIYKQGTLVGEGNIFERHVTTQTVYGKERESQNTNKHTKGDSRQMQGEYVDLMLIPCRRRDLLVQSNKGGGFRFTFEDLDPDNPDNEITPANARFYWEVSEGQAKVLCAPINFATSGNLISKIRTTRLSPDATETPTLQAYADQPGYGSGSWLTNLLDTDGVSAFAPDGTKNQVRLEVTLTGDGTATPFVYGCSAVFDAVPGLTDGSHATDITRFVQHNNLSVPESADSVSFKVTCNQPAGMVQAGAAAIATIGNRPVECAVGGISFLTGRSKVTGTSYGIDDVTSHVMLEFRDRMKAYEEYRFADVTPYDGLEMADAETAILTLPGYPASSVDIPPYGFKLPTVGETSKGEWALIPEVGDKAIDWLNRLHDTFARHMERGWVPTVAGPVYRKRSLDYLNAQPSVLTLYSRIEDAINAGIDRSLAQFFVYRTFEPQPIEPEANDIWVTGQDPRTGLPFQYHYADVDSQNPALAPGARPLNWLGEPREYAWVDAAITDEATASWVCTTLLKRLSRYRLIIPFECEWLIKPDGSPVWKGDKITLDGVGDVRITTFSGDFHLESQQSQWRPFHYTGEFVFAETV